VTVTIAEAASAAGTSTTLCTTPFTLTAMETMLPRGLVATSMLGPPRGDQIATVGETPLPKRVTGIRGSRSTRAAPAGITIEPPA